MNLSFFLNSIVFGAGLAADAFTVSVANGLNEPKMKLKKTCLISGTFALFQFIMPLAGWFCVRTVARAFALFEKAVPLIGFALLIIIGVKMIADAVKNKDAEEKPAVGFKGLLIQGIATSIDALSVGFTIENLSFLPALTESLIIGAVTFAICFAGCHIGRKAGAKLAGKAGIIGGIILIGIALKIIIEQFIH
ncbi:MAG: manganese efflux pump [Clostridia bacterium]|nr:manganese efflux pump [Clostridia bacterium]